MKGPTAPKDPEKKNPYFYIIRDKEIFGAKQEDEKGVQFIYENDGRLINSAQITGNISDPNILEQLKTTQGFRTLVHSIGVSVETEEPSDNVDFIFQMYGHNDIYGGGTNLKLSLTGNGVEEKLKLSDVEWSEDDKEPGQIRFEFDTPEILARANVRLYLNEGFSVPEVSEESEVDVSSEAYHRMIARSLMQLGNSKRLAEAIKRAKEGKDVTLAYIGGSITQGAGATPINTGCYAYKSYRAFADRYGNGNNVHFIKAGVGGTPSELGMLRFDRDVLRDGSYPDVVVIEFGVNDEGDETKGNCYESLVKKILMLPNQPAVILLFAVFANDWNLQERLSPVGRLYELPMVSALDAVSPQFPLTKETGRVISKNQFFYDIFHPTNAGHTIMADCITYLLEQTERQEETIDHTAELLLKKPAIGDDFVHVKLLDKKDNYQIAEIQCGGFIETDTELQRTEMDEDLFGTPQFPYNWMYDGTKSLGDPSFELKINCRALLLIYKDSGSNDVGKADVFLDGKKVLTADPRKTGWVHCNPVLVCNEKHSQEHILQVNMAQGDETKKFTTLGFGYVN
ncbi:SGNH/GDSL hydrolase family protein [Lacrimispora sp.]|uniref:SGNH/GDSL hydrolase family protein n=1 Tax=Lacrimispora sp. TaxID=2719234 RepID=UPI0028AA7A27|nr:SGNH/GDSL hydrolase family protein [Lacrimispora sp.]